MTLIIVWDVLSSLGLMNKVSPKYGVDMIKQRLTQHQQHAKLLFLGLYAFSLAAKTEYT